MKKLTDEEIQKLLEAQSQPEAYFEDKDFQAYEFLFKELKKEPSVEIPADFSANLTAQLQAEESAFNSFKLYLLITLSVITALGLACISLYAMNNEGALLFIAVILNYKWIITFSVMSFLLIQYLDQKLVKKHSRFA